MLMYVIVVLPLCIVTRWYGLCDYIFYSSLLAYLVVLHSFKCLSLDYCGSGTPQCGGSMMGTQPKNIMDTTEKGNCIN